MHKLFAWIRGRRPRDPVAPAVSYLRYFTVMTTAPEFPSGMSAYPEQSQATIALVLGILSFLLIGILAPFAWLIGSNELAAIDAGRRSPDNRGTANAGRVLGIVGTALVIGIATLFMLAVVGVIQVS